MRKPLAVATLLASLLGAGIYATTQGGVAGADAFANTPTRVMDTRSGIGVRQGPIGTSTVTLTMPWLPVDGDTAVFVNLTAVDASQPGFVSAWPCGSTPPTTSILNFEPGRAVTNMAVLAVTSAGVCFRASSSVQLIADVTATSNQGDFVGIAPKRLLDTRGAMKLAPGVEQRVVVGGTAGVPANAGSAAVNVTIVTPDGNGYAIVKPCGSSSDASTINFLAGEVVPHFTFSGLTQGALCVTSSVATDLLVDSFGYMGAASALQPVTPARLMDTRNGTGGTQGGLKSGQTATLQVAGKGGIATGAGGATVNVAVVNSSALGFLTVWPCDADYPTASTINMWPGGARSNQATFKLSASGTLCIRPYIVDGSRIDVVIDAVGTMSASSGGPTPPPPPTTTTPPAGAHFNTLPVGATLPSGAECANRVRPAAEVRPENAAANANRGSRAVANTRSDWSQFSRIDGDFSGTTDEIIQWAACKWGIDEDIVRAQVIKESYWYMSANGDNGESWGLGQVRDTAHQSAFQYSVNARNSSAYNLDYTYGNWRGCYEGVYTWLNTVERNGTYAAGDVWGCIGVWFSGRWYVNNDAYLNQTGDSVHWHYDNKTWLTSTFING